jgi:hypothetical protein
VPGKDLGGLSTVPDKEMMDPILTRYAHEPNGFAIDFYLRHEGYEGLRRALAMAPNEVVEVVKASGLRGRVPDRPEVAVRVEGADQAEVLVLQCR